MRYDTEKAAALQQVKERMNDAAVAELKRLVEEGSANECYWAKIFLVRLQKDSTITVHKPQGVAI